MDFDLSPQQKQMLKGLATALAGPMSDPAALAGQLAGQGLLCPEQGEGGGPLEALIAAARLAELSLPAFWALDMGQALAVRVLAGLPGQGAAALAARLQEGQALAGMGLKSASAEGLPETSLSAQAAPGGWLVNGREELIVNGLRARVILAPAACPEGVLWLALERDAAGLSIDQTPAGLGPPGADLAAASAGDVLVPAEAAWGPLAPEQALAGLLLWQNRSLLACALGSMRACFKWAVDRAKQAPPQGKPLMAKQAAAFKLAELYTLLDTARLLAQRAAWSAGMGEPEAATLEACAKAFACEAAQGVAAQARAALGPAGLEAGSPLAQGLALAGYLCEFGSCGREIRQQIGRAVLAAG